MTTHTNMSQQLIMTQDLQAKNAQLPFVLISMFKLLENLITTMLQLQVIQLFSLSAVEHMTSFEETLHSCETVPVSSSNTNTHQLTKTESLMLQQVQALELCRSVQRGDFEEGVTRGIVEGYGWVGEAEK